MGYWSANIRPPVPGRKAIARLLILWIVLAVLPLAFGQAAGSLYVVFLGPMPFLFVPSLRPADPLARAVAKFTTLTVVALAFSIGSLFLLSVFWTTAFAYLTGAPLPELITHWDRYTPMSKEASFLMSMAFANGFAGMSLIGTVFKPVRNWMHRVPLFDRRFARFVRRFAGVSVAFGGSAFLLATSLYFWAGAGRIVESILAGMFWPALALVLMALALSLPCNGVLWLYALPARCLTAGTLVWRMALR